MSKLQKNGQRIALCGIKNAGKSTIGKLLAERMDLPFRDMDDLLQGLFLRHTGRMLSVREIFREYGEERFRKLEAEALREASGNDGVLALGGGTLSNSNLTPEDAARLGWICWIDVTDETAFERISKGGLPPFLEGEADPFRTFCESNLVRRETFRKQAKAIVVPQPDDPPESVAEKILKLYQEAEK